MEMDGLDSAKCKKSKRRDTENFGMFNEEKDKNVNSAHFLPFESKTCSVRKRRCSSRFFIF